MNDQTAEKKVQIGIYLPLILLETIRTQALKEDRSVNNTMVKALKQVFMEEDSDLEIDLE